MKTDKLMVALGTLKNAGKLRRVNKKKVQRVNGVRWSAQLGTMIREKDLRADLPAANFARETKELFLSAVDHVDADELVGDLKIFEKVNKALQGQGKSKDSPRLTVAQSRGLLDKLIDRFPEHNFTKITKNGPLGTHPVWENAIIKLQNNQDDRLSAAEKREVRIYLHPDAPPELNQDSDDEDFNVGDILSHQEKEAEARSRKTRYRSTKHIFTTSVIVECLFSRAKLILEDKRKSMSPWHMELILFLYSNRDLWDAHTLNLCMKEPFWSDDEEDPNGNDEE